VLWVDTLLVLSLLGSPQQGAAQGIIVSGVVQDLTGAVLTAAIVELAAAGRVMRSVVTDDVGAFHFDILCSLIQRSLSQDITRSFRERREEFACLLHPHGSSHAD
jgi:Kef-type K+ transport system membrane component KefB